MADNLTPSFANVRCVQCGLRRRVRNDRSIVNRWYETHRCAAPPCPHLDLNTTTMQCRKCGQQMVEVPPTMTLLPCTAAEHDGAQS